MSLVNCLSEYDELLVRGNLLVLPLEIFGQISKARSVHDIYLNRYCVER